MLPTPQHSSALLEKPHPLWELNPYSSCFAGHGHGHHGSGTSGKQSSATKGQEYDATGGAVDDRSTMQKLKDKLTPGSDVGKHTKA